MQQRPFRSFRNKYPYTHSDNVQWTFEYADLFSINTHSVFDPQLGVCRCGALTVCINLHHFTRKVDHLGILLSEEVPEMIPCRYRGTTMFWESQKLYSDLRLHRKLGPLILVLLMGQL